MILDEARLVLPNHFIFIKKEKLLWNNLLDYYH